LDSSLIHLDDFTQKLRKGVDMDRNLEENTGIQLLLKKYRTLFQIPENVNYYSRADFKIAEKKFLKFALMEGKTKIFMEA
jgi:hypothetical protein